MRLPRALVFIGLICALVIGHILIFKDKMAERIGKMPEKTMGTERLA